MSPVLSFASGTFGSHVCFHSFAHFHFELHFKRGTVVFSGAKNLAVNHSPLERGLAVRTSTSNCKPDGKAPVTWLLDVRDSRGMSKNLDLNVSYIVALVWHLRRKKKAWNIGILIRWIDNLVFLLVYVVLCRGKARKCLGLCTALVNASSLSSHQAVMKLLCEDNLLLKAVFVLRGRSRMVLV